MSLLLGRGLSLVAVALASNHVHIYDDKNIVDHFKVGRIDNGTICYLPCHGKQKNTCSFFLAVMYIVYQCFESGFLGPDPAFFPESVFGSGQNPDPDRKNPAPDQ